MKFSVCIATSVDGFVATPNGGVEWLDAYHDTEGYRFGRFVQQVDAIVMGRTTFDQIIGFGPWPYKDKDTFVLTSRPLSDPPPNTHVWGDGAASLVDHLKGMSLKGDIWLLGGPESIQSFRELGAVDEYQIYLIPIILGGGIPLFKGACSGSRLKLVDSHIFKDGVIQLTYQPK